jgi:hypothetical protein
MLNSDMNDEECDLVYGRGTAQGTMIVALKLVTKNYFINSSSSLSFSRT